MLDCGLNPTPDAIGQLVHAFLPSLGIMCGVNPDGTKRERYDPNGKTWRAEGWRGMLWKIRDKSDRLWFHGWRQGRLVVDHPHDMINYLGFYIRLDHKGDPWGKRGAPGVDTTNTDPIPKNLEWDPE